MDDDGTGELVTTSNSCTVVHLVGKILDRLSIQPILDLRPLAKGCPMPKVCV